MSTARSDLLIIIGVALATTTGLFVLHAWYATWIDVRFHQRLAEAGPNEVLLAAREDEQQALNGAKIPLKNAMAAIERNARPASVSPAPSQDLSAVSGWIHQRGFKPVTAHPVRVPAAPNVAQAVPVEEPAAK